MGMGRQGRRERLWDEESWHDLLVRQLQSVREAGLLAYLPIYLNSLAMARLAAAISPPRVAGCGGRDDSRGDGSRLGRMGAVTLEGFRGRQAEALALIEGEVRNASAAGAGPGVQ